MLPCFCIDESHDLSYVLERQNETWNNNQVLLVFGVCSSLSNVSFAVSESQYAYGGG